MLTRFMRLRRWTQDRLQERFGFDLTRTGFYSPIVDRVEVKQRAAAIWSAQSQSPEHMPGLDFRPEYQTQLLAGEVGRAMAACQFDRHPQPAGTPPRFFIENGQFGDLDARMLVGMLQAFRPKRVIEVGSGFSTMVMNQVAGEKFAGQMQVTAIEPFPRPFLGALPHVKLIQSKVQDVDPQVFAALESGDVLFIDSSHVSKTGSDVNHLFFEVLPFLRAGVLIHVHDIWLPLDYPQDWVLAEGRSWTEQYLLRALLTGSTMYQVELAGMYLHHFLRPVLDQALGASAAQVGVGSSFWIRKVA
ncbi:class I SAM-dependent methyltransferase [Dyella tabacisoli]|uniref:class I SAM-dependent methyltransferase n=1 Tax=Dyella tabacisoli TaxID=2282381 RepID=UPI0013B36937|nr:class I SAM-dependent methyltransferase [Dyella tabacisoli]